MIAVFLLPPAKTAVSQNYGLQFSTSSDIVTINRDDIPGEWTVEFWIKKTQALSYSTAIMGHSGKITVESWGNGGKVGITRNGVADWAFNYILPVGQWTHLAFVCNGTTTKLYVNGALEDEMTHVIDMPIKTIGQSNEPARMIIDEIRFWTTARTAGEIAEFYNRSANINSPDLTGYYFFDDRAPEATDISQSHVNGIINGPQYVENDNTDFTTTLPDMTFSEVTVENYNEYFSEPGSADQDILRINVVTDGILNPLTLNSLTVTLNGTDNMNDLSEIKIYYTAGTGTFSTDSLVGQPVTPSAGEISFNEDIPLITGNNYFWMAVDVSDNATEENKIDGTLSYVVIDSDTFSPSTSSPAGYRVIRSGIPQIPLKRDAVVPKPKQMSVDTSQKFILTSDTKIFVSDSTENEGQFLSAFLQKATGYPFEVSKTAGQNGNISLSILNPYNDEIGDEGYLLNCDETGITIEANTLDGIFYGTQTLRQLLPVEIESEEPVQGVTWDVSYADITDYPRFSWRGLHLDVSRHFFDVDFIKKYLDIMAANKLNRFHWHLTDDHGWRLEIQSKPLLQTISAWRTCNGVTYGGYYTQEQIADIVQYAADRHIMIIPEIEMPGHTIEVLAAYPELSCATASQPHGGPFQVRCNWGTSEHIFCAGKEATFDFIEDVLDEVCQMFPGPYIHLGGDEAVKTMWQQCPDCQARMQQEGLANEEELQRYFMERVGNYLISKGKKWIGWSEITYGGVPDSATVMSWLGESSAIIAAQQGHDAILSPYDVLYLDAVQSDDPNEPISIGYAPNTLEEIFFYDPMPSALTPSQQQYILGPHSCLWTEYISETDHAEYMILPRIMALSEIAWYGNDNDFGDFRKRVFPCFDRLDIMGYNYRPLDFPENILPHDLYTCQDEVTLTLDIPGHSFYWNNPGNSTTNSITVNTGGTYKCYVDYVNGIKTAETTVHFNNNITQPEVTLTDTTWNAEGNAATYYWYDDNDNRIYRGNNFQYPPGADPENYKISGVNPVNKMNTVYLKGNENYAELENSEFLNGTQQFTICSWVYIHDYTIWDQLFTKRQNTSRRISVELANDAFYFELGNGSNTYGYTGALVEKDKWYHLAFVYNGNGTNNEERMKVYINGQKTNLTYSGTIPATTASNQIPFTIGDHSANPDFEFTETSLWNIALDSAQIQNVMHEQLQGNDTGLVYYFKTEGNGDTLVNYCTNNTYTATIINYDSLNRKNEYTDILLYGCESEKWRVRDVIAGTNERNREIKNLNLFPNPNNGTFTLSFTLAKPATVRVNIYDMSGHQIYRNRYYNVRKVNDNLSLKVEPGTYILKIIAGGSTVNKKFSIHR